MLGSCCCCCCFIRILKWLNYICCISLKRLRGLFLLLVHWKLLKLHYLVLQICLGANQEWVEDPTNRSTLFTRNRIRMTLTDLSSRGLFFMHLTWFMHPVSWRILVKRPIFTVSDPFSPAAIFRSELQALIAACRRTRLHVDRMCSNLMHQAVTIMPVSFRV